MKTYQPKITEKFYVNLEWNSISKGTLFLGEDSNNNYFYNKWTKAIYREIKTPKGTIRYFNTFEDSFNCVVNSIERWIKIFANNPVQLQFQKEELERVSKLYLK